MQTRLVFRFRCHPTLAQKNILLQLTVCQRFIYNANPPVGQQYIRYIESELTPGRKDVSSHVRRNGAVKWMQTYKPFFHGVNGRPMIKNKTWRHEAWLTSEPSSRFSGDKLTVGDKSTSYQNSHDRAECWHINPDSRVSRSAFICQACEHKDNADYNAGRVIARREVRLPLPGGCSPRGVKRCGLSRRKTTPPSIWPVLSEFTPVESIVSRVAGNGQTRGAEHPHSEGKKQETLSARKETYATILHMAF